MRELFAQTRPTLSATLTDAVTAFIDEHFAGKPLTIGCDDLRYGVVLERALDGRARIVDARPLLRKIRVSNRTQAAIWALNNRPIGEKVNGRVTQQILVPSHA